MLSGLSDVRFHSYWQRDSCATWTILLSHLFWLDQEHLKRIQHLFSKPRGVARSDDRKLVSGIIHVIRNGLRWRDAPSDWATQGAVQAMGQVGNFAGILTELASEGDATVLFWL